MTTVVMLDAHDALPPAAHIDWEAERHNSPSLVMVHQAMTSAVHATMHLLSALLPVVQLCVRNPLQ